MYDPYDPQKPLPMPFTITTVDKDWETVRYWDPVLRGYVSIRRKRIKSHFYRDID